MIYLASRGLYDINFMSEVVIPEDMLFPVPGDLPDELSPIELLPQVLADQILLYVPGMDRSVFCEASPAFRKAFAGELLAKEKSAVWDAYYKLSASGSRIKSLRHQVTGLANFLSYRGVHLELVNATSGNAPPVHLIRPEDWSGEIARGEPPRQRINRGAA